MSQTYKLSYDSTAVTVRFENTYRNFTAEELLHMQAVFHAAQEFVDKFYSGGSLRPVDEEA